MKKTRKLVSRSTRSLIAMGLSLTMVFGISMEASADEADAKRILKSMSDYLAAQKTLSFKYDIAYEIVTQDGQKLALMSSGDVAMERPNKIRTTRTGGFVDVETFFDGKTLTLLGKNLNSYTQVEIPGNISHLVDELRVKYDRPIPAADLLLPNSYDELMLDVIDIKDLGSGVINGVECDFLAFRKKRLIGRFGLHKGSVLTHYDIPLHLSSLVMDRNILFKQETGRLELILVSRTQLRPIR